MGKMAGIQANCQGDLGALKNQDSEHTLGVLNPELQRKWGHTLLSLIHEQPLSQSPRVLEAR